MEVLQTRNVGPVPARQPSHALNDHIDVDLLRSSLVAFLVDQVKGQVPLGRVLVPDGRSELVTVAEEAFELVLGSDALEVL